MDPVQHFSATYAEARGRFFAAAKADGPAVARHVHPTARGAADEDRTNEDNVDMKTTVYAQTRAAGLAAVSRLGAPLS